MNNQMKSTLSKFLLAAILPFAVNADVKPNALFTDGMVIQREIQAPVWGTADAGEQVTISGSWGETATVTTDSKGAWMVKLQTPAAGGPHTLSIKGKNSVEIKNVLSGEVWFCSGQSNMDFTLSSLAKTSKRTADEFKPVTAYIKNEIKNAKDELFRQFTVEKNTSSLEPLTTLKGNWIESSALNNSKFSATAYFFGRELRKKLNIPVGLIKCAWGGTKVEPWMPAKAFEKDKEMAAYFEEKVSSLQEQKKGKAGKSSKKKTNQQFPSTLFNAMVNPVIPYAIKGAIWYQGESNEKHNNLKYESNFREMISEWRNHWGLGDFPFYFAQLANFKNPTEKPIESDGWASICDQQRRTLGLKNTGMAVLSDIGEAKDIHPRNKIDVGIRLALWALKNDYKQDVSVWSGPLYKSHEIIGGKIIINFDSTGSGLMTGKKTGMTDTKATDGPLKHFQICGTDRQWKWAEAVITGKDSISVSHKDVKEPTAVRYAWAKNAESANLYNKEGLPASIFTTESEVR
jgi:sialate O-acetylesterase